MNIYSVDNIKRTIVQSNPLWNKYITISGKFLYGDDGYLYLANEDESSKIRIDLYSSDLITTHDVRPGEHIKLDGYLNYVGRNQKTSDDRYIKADNVKFSDSSFRIYFTPKKFERFPKGDTQQAEPTQGYSDNNDGCASSGCSTIFLLTFIIYIISQLV